MFVRSGATSISPIAIYSFGLVRKLSWSEHRDLMSAPEHELVLDAVGRPPRIALAREGAVRRLVSAQDVHVLGALALSERPLCPGELPTDVAEPSKVVERLRRRLGNRWVITEGRGEAKSYAFAVPTGLTAVVLVSSSLSVDINRLPWFGANG
jgi:hypothetical protein